ncbi:hypothetical protein [Paenirhodobacter sp.]|uniref:hypothetical protein n=1 Tax=Paenirhodobacter sp. TaxID=1965326 RepID=UPI003B40AF09
MGPTYVSSFRPDFDMAIHARGAEELFSGSVNLVRKRPTERLQSAVALFWGSWNNRPIDADTSGALRGRLAGTRFLPFPRRRDETCPQRHSGIRHRACGHRRAAQHRIDTSRAVLIRFRLRANP